MFAFVLQVVLKKVTKKKKDKKWKKNKNMYFELQEEFLTKVRKNRSKGRTCKIN